MRKKRVRMGEDEDEGEDDSVVVVVVSLSLSCHCFVMKAGTLVVCGGQGKGKALSLPPLHVEGQGG